MRSSQPRTTASTRIPGVDWQGLTRAVLTNVTTGGMREGGGTITMQLARNTVLTSERTLRRKLKEVFLALRLEREFIKQEILTLYLNRIFLGQRAYGVGSRGGGLFRQERTRPDVRRGCADRRAASVALARQSRCESPSGHDSRRAYVLRRMLELGKIDQASHDAALRRAAFAHVDTGRSSRSTRHTLPKWCALK